MEQSPLRPFSSVLQFMQLPFNGQGLRQHSDQWLICFQAHGDSGQIMLRLEGVASPCSGSSAGRCSDDCGGTSSLVHVQL
eukprot:6631349-Alexandrium_andersonii.AAC.1